MAAEGLHFSVLSAALKPTSDSSRHSNFWCHFKLWPSSSTSSHFVSIVSTSFSSNRLFSSIFDVAMQSREQIGKLQSGHRTLPSTGRRHSTQTIFCCLKKMKYDKNEISFCKIWQSILDNLKPRSTSVAKNAKTKNNLAEKKT